VQFLAQELVTTLHTTYPKVIYIGLVDLRYCRFRFFTFLFFMLKISRNRLDEYNKSCSTPHQGSRKIGFAFF
jgi:hypothetical protein